MDSKSQFLSHVTDESVQQFCTDVLKRYLIERGYASETIGNYRSYSAHFLKWIQRSELDVRLVDETHIKQFLDDHLVHCDCGWRTHSDRKEAHAALGHLLVVLRTLGAVAPRTVRTTPVDEELHRFDEYMEHVRGLAPKTRSGMLRIVRELLWHRFHDRPVVISALTPENVRSCFARLTERYHAPGSIGSVTMANREQLLPTCRCASPLHTQADAPELAIRRHAVAGRKERIMSQPSLQSRVRQYLNERRRLGYELRQMGNTLSSFARHVDKLKNSGPLTLELMAEWARRDKHHSSDPQTWARRLKLLRPFMHWLQQFEPRTEVPDDAIFGRIGPRVTPHIYTDQLGREDA